MGRKENLRLSCGVVGAVLMMKNNSCGFVSILSGRLVDRQRGVSRDSRSFLKNKDFLIFPAGFFRRPFCCYPEDGSQKLFFIVNPVTLYIVRRAVFFVARTFACPERQVPVCVF
jgi:hypothetical protein